MEALALGGRGVQKRNRTDTGDEAASCGASCRVRERASRQRVRRAEPAIIETEAYAGANDRTCGGRYPSVVLMVVVIVARI